MKTITVKLEPRQVQLLKQRARTRGCSEGAVLRELIEQHLSENGRQSLHERSKDLCGCLSGPKDLSTRPLRGYGRD